MEKNLKLGYKFERYFPFLQGVTFLKEDSLPDIIIMLDNDKTALHEIKNLQIPIIGLVDTDMDPNDFILKFYGNNDSKIHLNFFFQFLQAAAKQGRLKEQQLFFFYLILKIKKKINAKKN
jgi:ribosomal protein S2